MCSILKYNDCIGRNFDYEVSYNEEIRFVEKGDFDNKYKVVGMATGFINEFPLLYDGMNECGLCIGALAFEGNAVYFDEKEDKINIPSYEFPLRILGNFKNVDDVKEYLKDVNISNAQFSEELPSSALHWFISDIDKCIVVESLEDGLHVHDNPNGVMTNNPPFPKQLTFSKSNLGDLGNHPEMEDEYHSRGLETYNLPGDYTSEGRFSRLTYLKQCLEGTDAQFDNVVETFHLLSSAEQIYGVTHVNGKFEYTIYSVVYDMSDLKVFVKFYDKERLEYSLTD